MDRSALPRPRFLASVLGLTLVACAGIVGLTHTMAHSLVPGVPPPPGYEQFAAIARAGVAGPGESGGWGVPVTAWANAGARTVPPAVERSDRDRFTLPLTAWRGISDPFGVERGPGYYHGGIDLDLAGHEGSRVYAACDGLVTFAGWDDRYGNYVEVDCGDGWSTISAHFSQLAVSTGASVAGGRSVVGISGTTGYSTGEHLHFEVHYQGVPIDPQRVLDFGS